jgi:hypothetical protein
MRGGGVDLSDALRVGDELPHFHVGVVQSVGEGPVRLRAVCVQIPAVGLAPGDGLEAGADQQRGSV